MKRLFFMAAVLAIVFGSAASADYLIVKVDLNQLLLGPKQPLIVIPKVDPNAFKGKGGNFGGGGKFGGGGQFGGQQGGFPPGFDPTQVGGQPPDPTGQGGQKDAAKAASQSTAVKLPPIYVHAYFETKKNGVPSPTGTVFEVELKGSDLKKVIMAQRYTTVVPTGWHVAGEFGMRFDKAVAELKATPTDEKKQKFLGEAEWALQRGLQVEFKKCIDKLKEVDAKHPVVAAIERLGDQLKKAPLDDDPAAKLVMDELVQKEGYKIFDSDQGHYRLLTNIKSSNRDADVKRKLAKLETLYNTFFAWHAIKGKPLPLPAYRLVVVLMDAPPTNPNDFLKKHAAYDQLPMVGTGFTARRDNVVFLSSHRLDEAYIKLDTYNQEQWEKNNTSMNELAGNFNIPLVMQKLQAKYPSPDLMMEKFNEYLELHILAYCQKAMEDENEIVSLSHEGVRQLIAATNVLPRDVHAAEWAHSGLASFFEVPPQSFFPSTGGANWNHLVHFKALVQNKKLEKKLATEILLNIVSDTYFRDAYAMHKASLVSKETKEKIGPKAAEDVERARATAWSLVHFLAHKRDKEFARFLQEIKSLPRDLDYDGKVLRDCFLRSFNLLSTSPDKSGQFTINAELLDTLAQEWFFHADRVVSLDSYAYESHAVNQLVAPTKTQPLPAGKGGPGGAPGKGGFPGVGGGGQQGGPGGPPGGPGSPPGIGGQAVPPGGQGGVVPPVQTGGTGKQ